MAKTYIDLGVTTVGILSETKYAGLDTAARSLTILEGSSLDDGAYSPPQHVYLGKDAVKSLYLALKACFEPEAT